MFKSFMIGALCYPALELLYRRRTHYSMAIAGGISTCLLWQINRIRSPLILKAALGSIGITTVELLCGKLWNRNYAVWDYRRLPLNYQGQICLPFSCIWFGLSAVTLLSLSHFRSQQ